MHLRKHLVDKKQSLDQIIRAKAQLVKNRLSYGRPFDRNRILADIVYGSWEDAVEAFSEAHYHPQNGMMEAAVLALIRSGGYSGRLYGYGPVIAMQPASFAEFVRLFDESIALMKDLMRDIERGIRERRIERERYLMVMRIEAQTERALKGQLAPAPDADDSGIPNQPFSGPGWIALT